MRRITLALIFTSMLAVFVPTARAATVGPTLKSGWKDLPESSLTSDAAIVLDSKTGKVLYEKNPDAKRVLASLTKIMTSVIFVEQKPSWSRVVAMSDDDEVGGGRLQVATGTKLTNKDLLYCALVGSANNTATAMMNNSGLSDTVFIDQMNVRAATLGMSSTRYDDASGMDPRNVTTARDMSKLVQYAFGNPTIQKAASTMEYRFSTISPVIKKKIKNTDELLLDADNDLWIVAGKTGYLDESKYNLAIKVKDMKKTRELVVVTLGADTKRQSFDETEKLTKWAWDNYEWK